MRKYKIVKFQDANSEEYYEVWTTKPSILSEIFGEKWTSLKEGEFSSKSQSENKTAKFVNLNQAQYAVRSLRIKETVIEEGNLDET